MNTFPVVFLGTPEFGRCHLETLINDSRFDVVGVISQPDRPSGRKMKLKPSPVKELALEKQIPCVSPDKVQSGEIFSIIEKWGASLAVVVAFGQILPQSFLDLFPKGVVNVHGSVLPRWRGAAPIQRALMEGDSETGVSLQVMVKKLDAGPLIGYRKISVKDGTNALELHDQLKELGAEMLKTDLIDFLEGHREPIPQDENQVTYASKIQKIEGLVHWSDSSEKIVRQIRGLAMGPGTYSFLQGKKTKIHKGIVVVPAPDVPMASAGEIVGLDEESIIVSCGKKSFLRILEIQPESRARMNVNAFLKGHPLKRGDRFCES